MSGLRSLPPVCRLSTHAALAALALALTLAGCQSWLVEDASVLTPTAVPPRATEAPDESATPLTPSPTATITLTPAISPTPPIGPTQRANPTQMTATAQSSAPDNTPVIEYFVAFPTEARPGDIILLFWSARNVSEAAIWRIKEDGSPGRTYPVAPEGELQMETMAVGRDEIFVLSVTNGMMTVEQEVAVTVTCGGGFFFEPAPEEACPDGDPVTTNATFQSFERGQMIWLHLTNQVFILFTDVGQGSPGRLAWTVVGNPFADGMPEDDPALVPPPGLLQPRRELGMVWRDTPGVRDRIGWAIGEPQQYSATFQNADIDGSSLLFLTDPIGSVLALYANGITWQVAKYGGS